MDLDALAALPEVVRQLEAEVAALKARLDEKSEAEALLDVAGAAKMLHMTPGAVRAAAYRGTQPRVKVGSRRRRLSCADPHSRGRRPLKAD
jgi:hypothetical protein